MKYDIPILISSNSKYSDCWEPLSKSLETSGMFDSFDDIYLICDKLDSFENKNFLYSISGTNDWSDSLKVTLNQLKSDYFIYMQEDYFIRKFHAANFEHVLQNFKNSKAICCYFNKNYVSEYSNKVVPCSLQMALWRTRDFQNLIEKFRDPWLFEIFGRRYCLRHNKIANVLSNSLVEYTFTAVNKGKWSHDGVHFLASHGYQLEFLDARGLYHQNKLRDYMFIMKKCLNIKNKNTKLAWINGFIK